MKCNFFALITVIHILLLLCETGASEPVALFQSMTGKWYQVERSNWSQYRDGKYIGLTHRETRTTLTAEAAPDGSTRFSGFCYVLEETKRDLMKSARSLDEAVPVRFSMTRDGRMSMSGDDHGYPRLRNFPLLPSVPVHPGDRWEGESFRVIDPRNSGDNTTMPIQVGYEYIGQENYKGIPVHRIRAKYATRIHKYRNIPGRDPLLTEATGTHDIDILISRETGAMILMLDRLDETFLYTDGASVRFRGSTAVFGEIPAPVDRESIVKTLKPYGISGITRAEVQQHTDKPARSHSDGRQTQEDNDRPGKTPATKTRDKSEDQQKKAPFVLEETDQGVRLSLRDIRFVADSSEILPEEAWRLDAIAKTLTTVPGGRFLVEGHTADIGNPAGQKKLSVERAERIIRELAKRGLEEDQFIFSGYGGNRPVADNGTEEGRALNRRVEITILE